MISIDVRCVYETTTWTVIDRCRKCDDNTSMTVRVSPDLTWVMKCDRCNADSREWHPHFTTVRFVYGLLDPRTELVSYVGCSRDPIHRYRSHLTDKTFEAKYAWVRNLIDDGVYPAMIIFGAGGKKAALAMEKEWIDKLSKQGHPLINVMRPLSMVFNIVHGEAIPEPK